MNEDQKVFCPGIRCEGNAISIDLSVYFSNPEAIPASVFAESVQGMDGMMRASRIAIARIMGIDTRAPTALYLQTVRNGSKIEDFIFRIFLGSDEEANRTADALHKRFGINKLMESKHVQNIIITAIIALFVRDVAVKYMEPNRQGPAIEATNSIIVNAGRDLNIRTEDLERIIHESVPNPAKVGKDAVRVLQPAVQNTNTLVKIGGANGLEIPKDVVEHLPPPRAIETKELPSKIDINAVDITVQASDIDRRKTGWAVKLPDTSAFPDRRIRAVLDPTIRPEDLMYKSSVNADVTVYMSDGKPTHLQIRAINL